MLGALAVLLLAWAVYGLATNDNLSWDVFVQYVVSGPILEGLAVTLELSLFALAIGLVLGTFVALGRMSKEPVVSNICAFYVWFLRGLPVIVQLLFWGNIALFVPAINLGIPFTDISFGQFRVNDYLTPFIASFIGLGLAESAYMSEIIRRVNEKIYDEKEFKLALEWVKKNCKEGMETNSKAKTLFEDHFQLSFQLTGAQQRVWQEIARDLAEAHPMQRLLQGDVGSGKTIVAALAACQAIECGWQAAFMAPTEILAEQHYKKLSAWLEPLGITVAWLSGSLKSAKKKAAQQEAAAGAQLVVGTHALIQADVDFLRLGLAIVDEQHRFGVAQRLELRKKGKAGIPHQLMMSATPIPRTLAMSYYADLDVSVIDELPPGRTPIRTKLVSDARRDEVVGAVRHAVESGRQAYWVCPLIEESEKLDLQAAIDTHAILAEELEGLSVGLVHGRLKPDEKAATMAAFAAGEIQVLVATTVIEVGVNVPEATVMVIEHAERFGLAQLHQLRGRVGRGEKPSSCLLMFDSNLTETARARLKTLRDTEDGFVIAEEDLRLRGAGEVLGTRQSGLPGFRMADLAVHGDLLAVARDDARLVVDRDPDLASPRGQALRTLLYLFERDAAAKTLRSG